MMKKIYRIIGVFLMIIFTQVDAQENDPKSLLYIEVNNNSLLNANAYTLENSNQRLFDIVNIFAANINYDSEMERAYVYLNNNVTKVVNNYETYVQPLQENGTKVLLTMLGNHQGAGICNFESREAARDFALQLKHTVDTYHLDGVDFDDEYSQYGQNGTGPVNDSSFVMLVQELRDVMPDKLINFYYYGPAVSNQTWNDYRVGDYIDYSYNALYGTFINPNVPPLTNEDKSAAAVWIGNTPNNTTTTLAQNTINDGYGIFLWYDLKGVDQTLALSAGTQTLYGENAVLSGELESWTAGINCDPPIGLVADTISSDSAILNWNGEDGSTYDIDYKEANSDEWISLETAYSGSEIELIDLSTDTQYDWRIRKNCSVNSAYIFAPRFSTETLGIQETSQFDLISIAPNPVISSQNLTINLPESIKNIDFKVLTINGILVDSGTFKSNENTYSTSKLTKGIYLFEISSKNFKQTKTFKVVVK